MNHCLAITSLCLALLSSATAVARTPEQIDAVVLDEMARQNIVGMAVGIVKDGRIYYASGYGHADLARSAPVTTRSVFRWGSVSKTLTATATLKLAELNPDFDLDDRVSDHVSYWPARGDKGSIRISHLLSNRSGISHYRKKKRCPGNPSPDYARNRHTSRTYDARQGVAVFQDQPLCFRPGTGYRYSTFGYSLLGAAIEGGSGTRYADWVTDTIKTPLEMASLKQATGRSRGYDQHCHVLREIVDGNAAWKLPGGGWESDVIDFARFANALVQGKLLNNTSRLWTTVPGNQAYGYGIKYSPDRREVWHEGKNDNSRALLYLYPGSGDRLGIVLMINGVHSKPMRIARHLADLFGRDHDADTTPLVKLCDRRCDGRFSAVWHRTGDDVLLRRGYRHHDFYAEWKFLRQAGYYTDDFEPYVQDGTVYWDAVFRKGPGDSAVRLAESFDQLRREAEDLFRKGYRLVDLETYRATGARHWAGLFRSGAGSYALFNALTSADLSDRQRQLSSRGYRLIDIEPYVSDRRLNWAGVWRSGEDGLMNLNLDIHDFAALRHQRLRKGYRLIDVESYLDRGGWRWAGVWDKSPAGDKWIGEHDFCGGPPDGDNRDKLGITDLHNHWRERGYELVDWERD